MWSLRQGFLYKWLMGGVHSGQAAERMRKSRIERRRELYKK